MFHSTHHYVFNGVFNRDVSYRPVFVLLGYTQTIHANIHELLVNEGQTRVVYIFVANSVQHLHIELHTRCIMSMVRVKAAIESLCLGLRHPTGLGISPQMECHLA